LQFLKKSLCCYFQSSGSSDFSDGFEPDLAFAYAPRSPSPSCAVEEPSANLSGIWLSPDVSNDTNQLDPLDSRPWRVPDSNKKPIVASQKTSAANDAPSVLPEVPSEHQEQIICEETDTCSEAEEIGPPQLRENYMPMGQQSTLELAYMIFDLGYSGKQLEEMAVCQINLGLKSPLPQAHDFSLHLYTGNNWQYFFIFCAILFWSERVEHYFFPDLKIYESCRSIIMVSERLKIYFENFHFLTPF
jgi:hypothetical protein